MWTRRQVVGGAAALVAAPACAQSSDAFTPEAFGARGDGRTNDTSAFQALARAVSRAGGGTIALRAGATYSVGRQTAGRAYAGRIRYSERDYWRAGEPVLQFHGLRGPLAILGNGATMRTAPGLRYGTFDPRTGRARPHGAAAFTGAQAIRSIADLHNMIEVWGCGDVRIEDLELDGNGPRQIIGAGYGDTGRQIAASGLFLYANRGRETLRGLHVHHFLLDNLYLNGSDAGGVVEDCRFESGGRQAMSLTGGTGHRFLRCDFDRTGRDMPFATNPAAGVDLEPENGRPLRGARFEQCRFRDNAGAGLVADGGDTSDIGFENCRFEGTTNYAAWPNRPGMRFRRSTFVGPIVSAHSDARRPERAAAFEDCIFTSDPAQASTGRVYFPGGLAPLADLGGVGGANVRFTRCRMDARGRHTLPFTSGAVFEDCVMRQERRDFPGFPRGLYRGRNRIDGTVDLSTSSNRGELVVNGVARARARR